MLSSIQRGLQVPLTEVLGGSHQRMLAGCICALLSEVAAPVVSQLPQAPAQPGAPLKDIFLD
jgi:hypothetical protein